MSHFPFLCYFVVEMPDPDLYRSDFDPIALTPGSNDPIGTFRRVSTWLRKAHAFEVGLFDFLRLTNVYSFDFEFSTSTAPSNESIRMICVLDGWLGRHR